MDTLEIPADPFLRPVPRSLRRAGRAWKILAATGCLAFTIVLPPTAEAVEVDEVERWAESEVSAALAGGLEPEDFHHVYLALEHRQSFADWRIAETLLDRLSADSGADPLMADVVRFYRARLALDEGRPAASFELFRTMGGLSRWWVGGVTSIEELQDFESGATLPDASAPWRFVPGTNPLGWLRLEGLGWPARRQGVTLAVTLDSDSDQPVAIRLGAAQVARVWLNSETLFTTDYPLRAAEDQVAASGWLRAGRNTLVIAVASESADWWLRARLTAPDGSHLLGVREVDEQPQTIQPLGREPVAVGTLEGRLRTAVEAGEEGARLALAALLVRRNSEPKTSGAAREACRAARSEDPALATLLESLVVGEPGRKRDLLVESLAAGGPPVPLRPRLARWYFERGLYRQAQATLESHLDIPAVRAASLDLDARRWGPIAFTGLEALAARHPRCLEVLTTAASWALEFERWAFLEELLAGTTELAPGLPKVERTLSLAGGACGDADRLRKVLTDQLARDPNNSEGRIRLARMEAAEDRLERAAEILDGGLRRCPDHVELLLESAHLAHRAGHEETAADTLHEVLRLRPQNREAEQLLALMGERREETSWRLPEEALWALAEEADHLEGPNVVLLDQRTFRFLPGNLVEERVQQAFLVRDADRSTTVEARYLPFVPETQRLRVLGARILRADGTEAGARRYDTPRLSEPEVNIYYDIRLRVLRFDDLEDGDLVEVAYVLTETAEANETGAYEGGILRLGHASPTLRTRIELAAKPEDMPAWELALADGEPQHLVDPDGTLRLRWSFDDLEAVPNDIPKAPPLLVQPHLVYSNHPTWGDLAGWYARHVAPRIRPSRQVEEMALELVEGVETREERIARIYHFVTDKIRYVGLEFGEHRFRPFSADWVLEHRMGDCKDTAGLLVALYSSIGIPAKMAMVRTSDLGAVSAELALLEDFNHAIAYLPEDDLWLDGTAAGHDVFPPPGMDQNAWALVVDGRDSKPAASPVPGGGRSHYHYTLTEGEEGRYTLSVRTEDSGDAAASRRARFAGRRNPTRFARWLQTSFPGAEVVGEPQVEALPAGQGTVLTLEAEIDRTALRAGGGLQIFPGNFGLDGEMTPTEKRASPLMLPVRPDLEWTLEIHTSGPFAVRPEPVEIISAFGALTITISGEGGTVIATGSFHLTPGLVATEDAGNLRQFLVEVRRALEKTVEIP